MRKSIGKTISLIRSEIKNRCPDRTTEKGITLKSDALFI